MFEIESPDKKRDLTKVIHFYRKAFIFYRVFAFGLFCFTNFFILKALKAPLFLFFIFPPFFLICLGLASRVKPKTTRATFLHDEKIGFEIEGVYFYKREDFQHFAKLYRAVLSFFILGKIFLWFFKKYGAKPHPLFEFELIGGKLLVTNYRIIFCFFKHQTVSGCFSILLPTITGVNVAPIKSRLQLSENLIVCTAIRREEFLIVGAGEVANKIIMQISELNSYVEIIKKYLAFAGFEPKLDLQYLISVLISQTELTKNLQSSCEEFTKIKFLKRNLKDIIAFCSDLVFEGPINQNEKTTLKLKEG